MLGISNIGYFRLDSPRCFLEFSEHAKPRSKMPESIKVCSRRFIHRPSKVFFFYRWPCASFNFRIRISIIFSFIPVSKFGEKILTNF